MGRARDFHRALVAFDEGRDEAGERAQPLEERLHARKGGIVDHDEGALRETGPQKVHQRDVEIVPPIEEQKVDRPLIMREGLHRIARAKLGHVVKPRRTEVGPRRLDLVWLDLRGDEAAAVVSCGRAEVDG